MLLQLSDPTTESVNFVFETSWVLHSLCCPKIGLGQHWDSCITFAKFPTRDLIFVQHAKFLTDLLSRLWCCAVCKIGKSWVVPSSSLSCISAHDTLSRGKCERFWTKVCGWELLHRRKQTFTKKKSGTQFLLRWIVEHVMRSCLEATLNCVSLCECFIQKSCKQTWPLHEGRCSENHGSMAGATLVSTRTRDVHERLKPYVPRNTSVYLTPYIPIQASTTSHHCSLT